MYVCLYIRVYDYTVIFVVFWMAKVEVSEWINKYSNVKVKCSCIVVMIFSIYNNDFFYKKRTKKKRTKSNNSKRLAHELPPTKHTFILFNTLLGKSLTSQLFHVVDTVNDLPRTEEHPADDQFFYCVGVGSRSIEYGYAELGHPRDGDVICTSTASM